MKKKLISLLVALGFFSSVELSCSYVTNLNLDQQFKLYKVLTEFKKRGLNHMLLASWGINPNKDSIG